MKNFLFVSLKIFCGMLIAALLLELALRILPTCHLPTIASESTKYIAKPIIPNQKVVYSRGWMFQIGNFVEINSDGFHSGTDYKRRADGNSVAFVGDSMIENIMVSSEYLMHPVLARKFVNRGADVSVFSLGNSGAGLADIVNFMRLGREIYNVKNFIIKLDYNDIVDDLIQNDGHFVYDFDGDKVLIKLIPKYRGLEKLKNISFVGYLFSHVNLSPKSFLAKLKDSLGMKRLKQTKSANTLPMNLSPKENALFGQFIADVLKVVDGNPQRVLFLIVDNSTARPIKEILVKYGFECVDIDAATHSDSEADLSHFHNDDHWNARGIERVCSAVEKTKFFERIANGRDLKNK